MKTLLKILAGLLIVAGIAFIIRGVAHAPEEIDTTRKADTSLPSQAGLPEAVEAKRQAIAAATSYEALAALAGDNFSYSFGGPYEGGFKGYLELEAQSTGIDIFERIDNILSMPYAKNGGIYVWPAVFLKESKDWTQEDMEILRNIATEKEIEQYREFGAYVGYRLGIREDGTWLYFIAGD